MISKNSIHAISALLLSMILAINLPAGPRFQYSDFLLAENETNFLPGEAAGKMAVEPSSADDGIKTAVIEGIRTYLQQIDGTCFSAEFSIGDIAKFEAAINKNINKFIVGAEGAAWLKKNSPSANSSHYAWRGIGRTADIIFRFDPRSPTLSMAQRQTMMHEMTHHIEWLNGVKEPSKYVTPITGTETPNPSSERNTNFQDAAVNAIAEWAKFDRGIKEKKMPLGQGIAAWKDLETALLAAEKGDAATGNKAHDGNLRELTGFNAKFEDIKNYYLNNKCGDDFRILIYLADAVPRLDWKLAVEGPEEMELDDEITLSTEPFDSVGGKVTLKPELKAKMRWSIPRREKLYGNSIRFRPTEAIKYPIVVELTVPFMGEDRAIARGEHTVTVNPKKKPTPTPVPSGSEETKLEFGGSVPGIWDGGKNPKGFDFARQNAKTKTAGECQWEAQVHSEIWGRIDPSFAPNTPEELAKKMQDLTADAKRWGHTAAVRTISISGFKGQFLDSSVRFAPGGWSDAGFRADGVAAYGRGWVMKGRRVVEIGYNVGGGGCWTNVDQPFLMSHANAAQAEAKAIIASLTLVEKGVFTKVPYNGPKLDGSDVPKTTPTPEPTPKATPKPTPKLTPTPKATTTAQKPPPPKNQSDRITGWYKHPSGDFRMPLYKGWTTQPDDDNKDTDMIVSPDERIGIWVKGDFAQVTSESEAAAMDRMARSIAKKYPGSTTISTMVGKVSGLRLNSYDKVEKQPLWFYFFASGKRVYYFYALMAPGSGNVPVPDELERIVTNIEILRNASGPDSPVPTSTTPTGTEAVIFQNTNIGGVMNSPTSPTAFTISRPHMITYLFTYHWNDARGSARPGTISLRRSDGTVYGPYAARGTPGQGGVPNANWEARPNVIIPAGTYTIVDSSPATWSQNGESGGRGHSIVKGYAVGGAPSTVPPVSNTGGQTVTAIIENRSNAPTHIFSGSETFGPGNKLSAGEKREIRVTMDASGRVKFTAGRNGQVITTKLWTGIPGEINRFPRVIFDGSQLLITTGLR